MTILPETIRQLTVNAEAIRSLLQTVSPAQAAWKPDPQTWSMQEVIAHVYNEERIDFRKHLKEMFSSPPQPWSKWSQAEQAPITSLAEGLEGFLRERRDSLAWLEALQSPDWDIQVQTPWKPIRAGDVLVSWAAHDYLHIRQMNELLFAWNASQSAPYSVKYAGDW